MAISQTPQLGCPGLKFELDGHIAIITIDRPELGNSLGGEMSSAIRKIWAEVRDNHAIRAAVITGAGERHFSTGAEVGRLSTDNADDGMEGWGVCIAPVNEWLAVSRRQVAAVREALVTIAH